MLLYSSLFGHTASRKVFGSYNLIILARNVIVAFAYYYCVLLPHDNTLIKI